MFIRILNVKCIGIKFRYKKKKFFLIFNISYYFIIRMYRINLWFQIQFINYYTSHILQFLKTHIVSGFEPTSGEDSWSNLTR